MALQRVSMGPLIRVNVAGADPAGSEMEVAGLSLGEVVVQRGAEEGEQ